MRRTEIDWSEILPTWSNYDLDVMEQDIRQERIRRDSVMHALRHHK